MKPTIWENCYESSWGSFITPEAFCHPAKFSRDLIERIYDHCLKQGWLKPGDLVGDAFGGIATVGITAAYRNIRWVGVELEEKFVNLGRSNINLHNSKLKYLGRPIPLLLQGDSRKFHEVVRRAGAVVTSPPYAETLAHGGGPDTDADVNRGGGSLLAIKGGYPNSDGQIGSLKCGEVAAVITSPPYAETGGNGGGGINVNGYVPVAGRKWTGDKPDMVGSRTYQGRANDRSDRNIEVLKQGQVDAVISSPPYSDIAAGAGGLNTKPAKHKGQQSGRSASSSSQNTDQKYGVTPGQISKLKGGEIDAVVTSPPWEDEVSGGCPGHKLKSPPTSGNGHAASLVARERQAQRDEDRVYGNSEGQIGKDSRETYWSAMKEVYSSCFLAIKPGGIIAVVVKDYVKNKERVRLCDDTAKLLEHVGFKVVERVHAMLTKETKHSDLFAGETTETRSRKSFFRRLAEKKGSPRIDYEEVIFATRL